MLNFQLGSCVVSMCVTPERLHLLMSVTHHRSQHVLTLAYQLGEAVQVKSWYPNAHLSPCNARCSYTSKPHRGATAFSKACNRVTHSLLLSFQPNTPFSQPAVQGLARQQQSTGSKKGNDFSLQPAEEQHFMNRMQALHLLFFYAGLVPR